MVNAEIRSLSAMLKKVMNVLTGAPQPVAVPATVARRNTPAGISRTPADSNALRSYGRP